MDWLAYGRYIARGRDLLAPCFEGSPANAHYGLGWWLGAPNTPKDLVYASGSAGQALYLIPSLDLTVVHFGASASFRHETFLRRLFPLRQSLS
jgi:CubicO group peptidase (beta-lactamase class C family)